MTARNPMLNAVNEGKRISDILKWEQDSRYCRGEVTFAQDATATVDLEPGQVLEPSSSNVVVCTTGASAHAILLERVYKTELLQGPVTAIALVRGAAIVDASELIITAAQKVAAVAALTALGIQCRD